MRGFVKGQRARVEKVEAARRLRTGMTQAEQVFWERVRRKGFMGLRIRRQQIIEGFIVDFYCERLGVVIELDGGVHEAQAFADQERDAVLRERGLKVLRFTNDEVLSDVDGVLNMIRSAVKA